MKKLIFLLIVLCLSLSIPFKCITINLLYGSTELDAVLLDWQEIFRLKTKLCLSSFKKIIYI